MKILHLYYDIMNLYGEYGNICVLERILNKSGVKFTTDKFTLGDNADINSYDFIYIGSGTEQNQKLVLNDFMKYRDSFNDYIKSGKVALLSGNSFEMLGKSIVDCDGKSYDGLNLFDFTTTEQNKTRTTGDVVVEAEFLTKPIVGFINKCSEIENIDAHLFSVKHGLSDNKQSKFEGIKNNNLFGTHITGPILVKNPHLLEYIAELISKNTTNFKVSTAHLDYERTAYNTTLNELTKRFEEN